MTQEEPSQRGARLKPNLKGLVRQPNEQIVLVVEDNWVVSDETQEVLREAGFRTVAAPNVEDALKEFENVSPDAAFFDLSLPYGPGSHSDKPEGTEAGLAMIREFRTRDPTFSYAIYSGRGSWEIAQKLTTGDGPKVFFLTKGATTSKDIARTARDAVTATAERRGSLLSSFPDLYASTYHLDSHLEEGTCAKVGPDLGEIIRIFHDRIPFSTNQGFYMDSLLGVVQLLPLDPTLKYAPQEKAFVLKRMTPVEFEAFMESSSAANEGLPPDRRPHAQAIASYQYKGSIYALIPQLFGPNCAYLYDLLDDATERMEEGMGQRTEGKLLLPEVMKRAVVSANVSQLSDWHRRISPRLSKGPEKSAAKVREYYTATARECLEDMVDRPLDARLSTLLELPYPREAEALSEQERKLVLQAYDGFRDLRLDAPRSVARLMDAKPQNSGVRLGIPSPSYDEVRDFLMPKEYRTDGIAPLDETIEMSESGIAVLRQKLQEPLEEHFLIYETHHRVGAVLEDLDFLLSNPDARLDTQEKIRHLLYFIEGYYEEEHRSQALADYGLVGLPKAQRMQFLQFETFQKKNRERHDRLVIGDEEFRETTLKYARNAAHWGHEFLWSAAFTHHVTSQIMEGASYQSLKKDLIRLDVEGHLGDRLQATPSPLVSSSMPNRMHALMHIGSKYFVPGPEMRQYLAETA